MMFDQEFKFLLETILGTTTMSEVMGFFNECKKEEGWYKTFSSLLIKPESYVEALANIYNLLHKTINPEQLGQKEDITFLAHGQVRRTLTPVPMLLPCNLFYMNDYVQSITLYEPWGCAIDATAAYGILTGIISIDTVKYLSFRFIYLFTVESRIFEPPWKGNKLGSKNREFEKLKVALNHTCFTMVWPRSQTTV